MRWSTRFRPSTACSSPSRRSSISPRAAGSAAPSALAGTLLNVKPILTIRDGEVVPLKKVRGQQKAFDEFRAIFEAALDGLPVPACRDRACGSARAARARGASSWRQSRPQAEVEVATVLGAVVGTHAGPGTVGLFWFDDPE